MALATTQTTIAQRLRHSRAIAPEDAPQLAQELAQLAQAHGQALAPATVVGAASDPASVLHRYFEWDDSAAAEAYRLTQARTLIRAIQVQVVRRPSSDRDSATRTHYDVVRVAQAGAVPLAAVSERENMIRQVKAQLERDLFGWRERVRTYQSFGEFRHFAAVLAAIDDLKER